MREILQRDLTYLLNTTNREDEIDRTRYPEAASSTINYGVVARKPAEAGCHCGHGQCVLHHAGGRQQCVGDPRNGVAVGIQLRIRVIAPKDWPQSLIRKIGFGCLWQVDSADAAYVNGEVDLIRLTSEL